MTSLQFLTVSQILVKNPDNFVRYIPFVPKGSLFTTEGSEYVRHTSIVGTAMKSDFSRIMKRVVEKCERQICAQLVEQKTVEDTYKFFYFHMGRALSLITWGDSSEAEEIARLNFQNSPRDFPALLVLVPGSKFFPITSVQRRNKAKQRLRQLQAEILHTVKEKVGKKSENNLDSLISLLVTVNLEKGNVLTDDELIGNAVGIGIGGNDSTAAGITSVLFCLAKNPSVQEKLRNFIISDNPKYPQFLNSVIKEAHRLYPPFFSSLPRFTEQTEEVCGWNFQKGLCVSINITEINRNPKYWENPEKFVPERFMADESGGGNSLDSEAGKSLTFGAGKRACIGSRIALYITRQWVAEIVKNFSVEILSGSSIGHNGFGLNLPKPELKLCFKPVK